MDVDMEVEEDMAPASHSVAVEAQSTVTEQFAELPTVANHDGSPVPPPPDEEWIPPPPPPDAEPMPPPPPDEPAPFPPPTEEGQPLPYLDQHNLSYSSANYQFYGYPEITSTNIYGQAEEGCQVVVPLGLVFNPYGDSASTTASNMAPVAYYQQGTAYPMGVVSAVESSLFPVQSDPFSYSTIALDPSTSVPSNSAIVEAAATTSVKDSGSTSAANPAAVVATSADAKVPAKVSRVKKRTVAVAPYLKSNKKVSNLVNKWKAAKEELEEDEEEEEEEEEGPKSTIAMLEKKRQREIEG